MIENTRSRGVCGIGRPSLPNGQHVGSYSEEGGQLIWTRNVCQKHLLRFLDAWTINDSLLRKLTAHHVSLIRYRSREGVYEVTLSDFLERATLLRAFACDEDVFAVARDQWDFEEEPTNGQLLLFRKRDDE